MASEYLGLLVSVSLSALAFWPPTTDGAIRCYCNSEHCATTGFACLSLVNCCFSKLYYANKPNIHGCLDSLPERQRGVCVGYRSGDLIKALETGDSLIMCCLDDLCNYKPNQDALIDLAKVNASFGSDVVTSTPRGRGTDGGGSKALEGSAPTESWFTAAVIAVPIAGSLILVVLVLVAVRMLQNDSRNSARQQRGAAKARLYIDSHFADSGAYGSHGDGVQPLPYRRSGGSNNDLSRVDCSGDDVSTCSTRDYEAALTNRVCASSPPAWREAAASADDCSWARQPTVAIV